MLTRLRPHRGLPNPSLPGCSRWFSTPVSAPVTLSATSAPFRPPTPLPPTLPYTPHSQPFLTHLHILSLALVHSPDASWEIYHALHASLKPFLSGDTVLSLIDHQLSVPCNQPKQRWGRLRGLIQHAKKSEISLGPERAAKLLEYGLRYVLYERSDAMKKEQQLLKALWALAGEPSRISPIVREDYILFNLRLHGRMRAWDVLTSLVEAGDADGLENIAGVVLIPSLDRKSSDKTRLLTAIERIGWLWTRGIRISLTHGTAPMTILAQRHGGLDMAAEAVANLVNELREGGEEEGAAFVEECLQAARRADRPPEQVLEEDHQVMPLDEVYGSLTRLLNEPLPLPLRYIKMACAVLPMLHAAPDPPRTRFHHYQLIKSLTTYLGTASPSQEALTLLSTLAHQLVEPPALYQLRSRSLSRIVILCIKALPHLPSADFLRLTKRFYDIARPDWQWTPQRQELFETFLEALLAPPHQQTIYASKLYTDAVADGLEVPGTSLLSLIKAHGRTHMAQSSAAFIERYLQDYLFAGYPLTRALGLAIVQGPADTKDAKATVHAFELCRRVFGAQGIPVEVHEVVLKAASRDLSESMRAWTLNHIQTMLHHGPPPTTACFEAALFSLVGHGGALSSSPTEDLGTAIGLLRQMLALMLAPSPFTVSYLLIGLLTAGHLDTAVRLFDALTVPLTSRAVGKLMIRLALADRQDEARRVERDWRALAPHAYDRGVVGARIFVDGVPRARKRGWRATEAFQEFMESRQSERGDEDQSSAEEQQQTERAVSDALDRLDQVSVGS